MSALDAGFRARIVPVIVIDDAGQARPLAEALLAGGISCAEVTLRTPAAVDALTAMAETPGFVVGAGTIVTTENAERARSAGAQFLVSPGIDVEILRWAARRDLPAVPGIATASELMRALDAGAQTVKLFPAAQLGGAGMITALHGPFPDVRFIPSGGIDIDNAAEYDIEPVAAISTSWIAPRALIAAGRFSEIADRSARFRDVVAS